MLANVDAFSFTIAFFKWVTVLLSSMSTRNGPFDTSRIQQKSVMVRGEFAIVALQEQILTCQYTLREPLLHIVHLEHARLSVVLFI
jgi:hypothetical protein